MKHNYCFFPRFTSIFAVLMLLTFSLAAQIKEDVTNEKKAPSKPETPKYNSSLVIDVDVDCRVFVDGEPMENVKAGNPLKIPMNAGQRLLQLKDEFGNQLHKSTIELEKDKQRVLTLSLKNEYLRFKDLRKETEEQVMWDKIKNEGTLEAMQKYLQSYPDGSYSNIAKNAIKKNEEQQAWQDALQQNSSEAYLNFLNNYPDGEFASKVDEKIEDILWEKIVESNNNISYINYLKSYPSGKYIEAAVAFIINYVKDKTGIEMIFVKGGTFNMGSNDCSEDTKPVHEVYLDSYFMGKHKITLLQFKHFVENTQHKQVRKYEDALFYGTKLFKAKNYQFWDASITPDTDLNKPVQYISYSDADSYCSWISKISGLKVRLPTEAEWEYAAIGGQIGQNSELKKIENLKDKLNIDTNVDNNSNFDNLANKLGLYGMLYDRHYNGLFEWCDDIYDKLYYANSPRNNPRCNKLYVKTQSYPIKAGLEARHVQRPTSCDSDGTDSYFGRTYNHSLSNSGSLRVVLEF